MEAATSTDAARKLEGDKAQRIVAAMRASVGKRGAAGSTFDHVAREAGVSRGLLHYYFGSKERLLVEVVRHDCDVRIAALDERAREGAAAPTRSSTRSWSALEEFSRTSRRPGGHLRDAQRLAPQRGDPRRAGRALPRAGAAQLAELRCATRSARAWSRSTADAEAVASMLFALGDGFGLQLLSDPTGTSDAGVRARRRAPRAACSAR